MSQDQSIRNSGLIGRFVYRLGWSLFLISFFLPSVESTDEGLSWKFNENGLTAFLVSPLAFAMAIASADGWRNYAAGLALGLAWLNNLTVIAKFPRELAWVSILIPWVAFLILELGWLLNSPGFSQFLPFYPWAIGIGMIHASVYITPTPTDSQSAFDKDF